MNETVNQEATTTTANEPERTFTQTELDAIVRDRLQRERNKYADYEAYKEKAEKFDAAEEAQKTELQKATERATALETELNTLKRANEIRVIRDQVAKETGVPATLLTADTEEACKEQAEAIKAFAQPSSGYPVINDAGEVTKKMNGTPQDSFSEWFKSVQK
jgi:hypothetical protein